MAVSRCSRVLTVAAGDFNGDGFQDLAVGNLVLPAPNDLASSGYVNILLNIPTNPQGQRGLVYLLP